MDKQKIIIKIDDREDKKIFKLVETNKIKEFVNKLKIDVEFKKERLLVSDYLANNIAIEKKSFGDFVSSIRTGHLYEQLLNMQENYVNNYLIIVGSLKECVFNPYLRTYTTNQYIGSIASLLVRFNVKLYIVDNDSQMIKLMLKIIEKSNISKDISIVKRISRSKDDILLGMLLQIPGLGEEKARLLLKQYKFSDIPFLDEDELKLIPGVGTLISKKIVDVFD